MNAIVPMMFCDDARVPAGVALRLPRRLQRDDRQVGIDAADLFADERREARRDRPAVVNQERRRERAAIASNGR